MTKEEIMALDMEGLQERSAAIAEETREADAAQLEELTAELDSIEERKQTIEAEAVEKRAAMAAVIEGEGEVVEEPKEQKKMDNKEFRSTPEYLDAWVEYQKGRATEEQRALLTSNAGEGMPNGNGMIAVPTYVEDIIHTAWDNNELMNRIRRTNFKGNLKVGYEASSEGAYAHAEGDEAIEEEDLIIGFVDLIPTTLKKMVRYSTEVMDMKGQAFIDYIFDEIEYQIVKTAADAAVTAMTSSTLSVAVNAAGAELATSDIINAEGNLSGEAENLCFITTRANAAALKAAALSANYGYDPFDGLDVIYTSSAALNGAVGIVADLSGVQANFPDGEQVKFVFDEFTEADSDIVRVVGRLLCAIAVVAPGKVAVILAEDESGK